MCLLGIEERPGVSWGVLWCPGVIRPTRPATLDWNSPLDQRLLNKVGGSVVIGSFTTGVLKSRNVWELSNLTWVTAGLPHSRGNKIP